MKGKSDVIRATGRFITNGYYDYQEIRKNTLNRIRDIIRKKREGIPFNAVEDKKEEVTYSNEYNDNNLLELLSELRDKGEITKKEEKYLAKALEIVFETKDTENKYASLMGKYVKTEPIWIEFMSKVNGIGQILATNLIKEFGYCENYDTVSKLWAHSGHAVTENGTAPKKRKGQEISYSPKLKTMVWKIGDCLMKSNFKTVDGKRTPLGYRKIYDKEKERQLNKKYPKGYLAEKYNGYDEEDTTLTKGHAHNRATRKMRKIFLEHYWVACRELTGQKTGKPYHFEHEGKDGKVHSSYIHWRDMIDRG